jgi:hypothetical protein
MTGTELRELFLSSAFKRDLEEMSSYLASIMLERPIVYLVAKCLWNLGHEFALEERRQDLSVNGKRVEFKFNYDKCEKLLTGELAKYGNNLKGMRERIGAREKAWGVMPRIYEDACVRQPPPDIFVWIICSRDLIRFASDDRDRKLDRICVGRAQYKYNTTHPYDSDGEHLTVVDSFLAQLQAVRPFRLLKLDIQTNGAFRSTYHFRICDFAPSGR